MKQYYQLALLFMGLLAGSHAAAQTVYVKSGATGANSGMTWTDAFPTLDAALSVVTPSTQVWVAAGTYKPAAGSFIVTAGAQLYGGFAGTETSLAQRNFVANATVLSGDILGDDIAGDFTQKRTDNALHVLYVQGGNPADRAVVDGFTIRAGNTNTLTTDPTFGNIGGGILAQAKLTVRNCTFTDNFARSGGGVAAIGAEGSGIIVDNCLFQGNSGSVQSAGVCLRQLTAGEVNKCVFRNNQTNRGSLFTDASSGIVVDSCLFENNTAAGANFSAGVFMFQTFYTMTNTVFRGNTAGTAAAMYNDGRDGDHFFTVDNCLFENNTASSSISAMENWQASFLLKNSTFRGNSAKNFAAMYNDGRDDKDFFTVDNCLFESNVINDGNPNSSTFGAAIYNWQATYLLKNSTFKKNVTENGGAIYSIASEYDSEFQIDSCVFDGNKATGYGGGALYLRKSKFDLTNSTFRNNTAGSVAGAIYTGDTTVYVIRNCLFESDSAAFGGAIATFNSGNKGAIDACTFISNRAVTSGGAIINGFLGNPTIKNCLFSQNKAKYGGGVFCQNEYTALTVDSCLFSENIVENTGGAINISSGIVANVKNSHFVANSATFAGAIDISEDSLDLAVLNVDNCVFSDNNCLTQAGALNQNNADVNLKNCLFSFNLNLGLGAGGAISSNASGGKIARVNAVNCTFASNLASIGAGIAQFETAGANAIMTLQNCLFKNEGDNYAIEEGEPEVTSLGGNLSSDATLTSYLTGPNDVNDDDPLLVDVDNYNFHIALGSPAIDIGVAAGAPPTDIEGNPRINEPDAGCYENQEVTGTNEAVRTLPLQLTPNPAADFVQLAVENDWRGAVSVELRNTAGAVVRTLQAEKSGPAWQYRVDVKELPQGAYFARARMGDSVYTGIVVKH